METLNGLLDGLKSYIYGAAGWIVKQFIALLDLLFNVFVDFLNLVISAIGFAVRGVIDLLPTDSTCNFPPIPDVPLDSMLNFINWILPVDAMACVIGVIVANYILYFTVGRILKFIQVM
jgi:hypothetical protein